MNGSYLIVIQAIALVSLTSLLILIYGMRHAPRGFQHYNLFYFGEAPAGFIPVESSADSVPPAPASWN